MQVFGYCALGGSVLNSWRNFASCLLQNLK
jgi:hypothetical protein